MAGDVWADVLKLKTNPFSPTEGPDGEDFEPDWVQYTLDPRESELVARYYHDVYAWDECKPLETILTGKGLERTVNQHALTGAVKNAASAHVVFICGDGDSGRRSLKNWLLYKLFPSRPILIEAPLGPERRTGALTALADYLIADYKKSANKPTKKELQEIYADKKSQLVPCV